MSNKQYNDDIKLLNKEIKFLKSENKRLKNENNFDMVGKNKILIKTKKDEIDKIQFKITTYNASCEVK